MNKAQLVETLSAHYEGNRRQASQALESVIDTISATVAKGEKVAITGFGVFEKVVRGPRTARNPRTGEKVRVKKTSTPKFRPGAEFKAYVSGAKKPPKAPTVKKAAAKKTTAKKTTAKKAVPVKKTAAKKATTRGTAARSTAKKVAKKATKRAR